MCKDTFLIILTFSFIMLKNGQTYVQKCCGVNTARFLKYVWPLLNIMNERVNIFGFQKRLVLE